MKRWEYRFFYYSPSFQVDGSLTINKLNQWGKEGWELVNVVQESPDHTYYYFKRPLQEDLSNEND